MSFRYDSSLAYRLKTFINFARWLSQHLILKSLCLTQWVMGSGRGLRYPAVAKKAPCYCESSWWTTARIAPIDDRLLRCNSLSLFTFRFNQWTEPSSLPLRLFNTTNRSVNSFFQHLHWIRLNAHYVATLTVRTVLFAQWFIECTWTWMINAYEQVQKTLQCTLTPTTGRLQLPGAWM